LHVQEAPGRFVRIPGKTVNELLKTPHRDTWERQTWVDIIWAAISDRRGEPEAVARDLILWMPVSLRAKCPGYPPDRAAFEAATVAVALQIKSKVAEAWHGGKLDSIKIGRATLTALGADRARDLLPHPKP
jgi:hypothetical protein